MAVTRPITTARINPNIVFLRVVRFDNNFFIEQPRQTRILERFANQSQKYPELSIELALPDTPRPQAHCLTSRSNLLPAELDVVEIQIQFRQGGQVTPGLKRYIQ